MSLYNLFLNPRRLFSVAIIAFILMLFSPLLFALSDTDADRNYHQALQYARAGKVNQALPVLARLSDKFPKTLRYRFDYILVLLWAGENGEVIRQSRKIDLATAPNYVLESVAQAARNLRQYTYSEKLYRQLLKRQPDDLLYRLGFVNVLIDQNRLDSAQHILAKLGQQYPDNADIRTVYDYLLKNKAKQEHQRALKLARSGKIAEALAIIDKEIIKNPDNKRYHYDYIQILQWSGKNREVLAQSKAIDQKIAPDYVLEAIAKASRNVREFVQAQKLYQILLGRRPHEMKYRLGLAGILIDQNNTVRARLILRALLTEYPDQIDVLTVQAYLEEVDSDYLAAAMIYERILRLKLNYKPAIRGLVFALSANKSFNLAYESALLYRDDFSNEEWLKLHWDLAANYIRWGELPARKGVYRFAETHQAITRIKKNLEMLKQMKVVNAQPWRSKARFDLLVALRDFKKMREVLKVYKTLQQEGVGLPAYAKVAVADALLYLQKPLQARDLYLEVLQRIPKSYNTRHSLVYAYTESEEWMLANELSKQMAREQPERLWFKSTKGKGILYSRGNPRKTESELATAVMAAFSDRLDEALNEVNKLYKNASFNVDIRNARANIFYYRGWPRQARKQLISALNIDPKHLGVRTSLSPVLHELREYPLEQQNTEALYRQYPEDKGVQQQKRLWNIHNQRELKIFTQGELSKTNSSIPVNGSEFIGLDSFLYSQPLAYHYRAFSHFNWQTGLFNDGSDNLVRGYFRRYGLGMEYAIPNLLATGEVHYDNFQHETIGFEGDVNYQFNDYWSAGLDYDSRSNGIGLRALTSGVTAQAVKATLSYRMHESRQFTLNHQYFDYSDGNQRISVNTTYFERWISGPVYKFSTVLNIGGSHNSKQIGNYYHPENDASTSVTVDNDFLTYRFYDLSFHQRVALTVGSYWQQKKNNNGSSTYYFNPTGSIQYEHRWKALDRYQLIYGATRGYAVYDGESTSSWTFYLNLDVRF